MNFELRTRGTVTDHSNGKPKYYQLTQIYLNNIYFAILLFSEILTA
jgi:hypothetical protein